MMLIVMLASKCESALVVKDSAVFAPPDSAQAYLDPNIIHCTIILCTTNTNTYASETSVTRMNIESIWFLKRGRGGHTQTVSNVQSNISISQPPTTISLSSHNIYCKTFLPLYHIVCACSRVSHNRYQFEIHTEASQVASAHPPPPTLHNIIHWAASLAHHHLNPIQLSTSTVFKTQMAQKLWENTAQLTKYNAYLMGMLHWSNISLT